MPYSTMAHVADFFVALGISFGIYALLRSDLRTLLDKTIRLPAGTSFYLRTLILVLILSAISKVIGASADLKPDAHFIEYVWAVASHMSDVLENLIVLLVIYVALVTLLVIVLKPKNE